jgi:hypothetical protein
MAEHFSTGESGRGSQQDKVVHYVDQVSPAPGIYMEC